MGMRQRDAYRARMKDDPTKPQTKTGPKRRVPARMWAWCRSANGRMVLRRTAATLLLIVLSPWWVACWRILLYGEAVDQAVILLAMLIVWQIWRTRKDWTHHEDRKHGDERKTHGTRQADTTGTAGRQRRRRRR